MWEWDLSDSIFSVVRDRSITWHATVCARRSPNHPARPANSRCPLSFPLFTLLATSHSINSLSTSTTHSLNTSAAPPSILHATISAVHSGLSALSGCAPCKRSVQMTGCLFTAAKCRVVDQREQWWSSASSRSSTGGVWWIFKKGMSDDMGEWDRLGRQSGGDARWVFEHLNSRRHNQTHRSNTIARKYETIDILNIISPTPPTLPKWLNKWSANSPWNIHIPLCSINSLNLTTRSFPQQRGMEEQHPKEDRISALAVSEGVFNEVYIPVCGSWLEA